MLSSWTEIELSKLEEASYNPRTITKDKLELLKHSLDKDPEFIKARPLLVNQRDGRLIVFAGNQRLKAARELKWEKIPCVLYKVPLAQEKLWNIKDNKEMGMWDEELLPEIMKELFEGELDYTLTGFDEVEVGKILNELYEPKEGIDDVPEPPAKPKSKRGEVYTLGKHRILCGDSCNPKDVEKLMDGKKAKLVFTSPPYNMAGDMYRNYDDNLKSQEYVDFNLNVIKNIREHLRGFLFWNISYNKNARWEWIEIFYKIIKETGLKFLEKIVWDKGHGTPITSKKQLTRQYEDILFAGTETEIEADLTEAYVGTTEKDYAFNKKTGRGITNYWRITTGETQREDLKAIFPVALPSKAILLMTQRGDVILDPFLGSGSTLIACEETNRICYGMEIEPIYIDVIIQRWENHTGLRAEKK